MSEQQTAYFTREWEAMVFIWPPCIADAVIIFLSFSSSYFPHLISAVADWMYTILSHMIWP